MDCYLCEDCVFEKPTNKLVYEVHVTIQATNRLGPFREVCKKLGIKPVILENVHQDGTRSPDILTKYRVDSDWAKALDKISGTLIYNNFHVIREKCETVPWHPAVPSRYNAQHYGKSTYLETHFDVTKSLDNRSLQTLGLHISESATKRYATFRSQELVWEDYQKHIVALQELLDIEKVITEFCIYDSNLEKDRAWMSA